MIWMAGPDALHTYFNPAWLEFRGRTLEEETGNGWTEGLHSDDRDLCLETYLKSFSARQRFRMQYRMMDADGEYSWLESVGAPVFNESGDFAGFIGSAADASGRRRGLLHARRRIGAHGLLANRAGAPGAGADRRWKIHQGSGGPVGNQL